MEALTLDDVSEKFTLPQIREALVGITDCLSLFLRVPKASHDEIEAIAKPAATLLARRPVIQNAVKKYAAPAVLIGAIAAYVAPRLFSLRARLNQPTTTANQGASTADVTHQQPAPGAAPASVSPAGPAADESARGAATPTAAEVAAIAMFAQNTIDAERSRVVQLG